MHTEATPSAAPRGAMRMGELPLVGRAREFAELRAAVADRPSVTVVEGPPGIGRTRLVAALDGAFDGDSIWVSGAACQPMPNPFPYGVLFDCLTGCADRLREPGPITGALRAALPEIADRLPPAPPPVGDAGAERHRLFRAVRELLCAVGPVALVLDDVHWADRGTHHLLGYLVARMPPDLALVLTRRTADPPGADRTGVLRRIPPGVRGCRLPLGPLDAAAVGELVTAIVGAPTSADVAALVTARTGGLPLFVREAAAALPAAAAGSAGLAAQRAVDAVPVPAGVRAAVAERVAGLPASALAVAEAAAVLGAPAPVELLAAVAGAAGSVDITALLARGLLAETAPHRYGWRLPLARRALYEGLPGPRRRDLHRRAIDALLAAPGDPADSSTGPPADGPVGGPADGLPGGSAEAGLPHAELAAHCRAAGWTADWLRYSERAATTAAEAGDVPAAIKLICDVVAEPDVGAGDVNRLATALCRYALAGLYDAEVSGRIEKLLSDPRLSADTRGEVHLWFGLLLIRETAEMDRARAEIALAIDLLGNQPARMLRGMAVLATPFLDLAPIAENRRWLARVEATLDELPAGPLRTTLLASTLGARAISGDPGTAARTDLLPAPSEVDGADEMRQLARAHCNIADAYAWTGHTRRARRHLERGLALGTLAGAPYIVATADATAVRLDWLAGEWAELDERIRALLRRYSHLQPITTELYLVRGWLAAARGDHPLARESFAATSVGHPASAIVPIAIAAAGAMAAMLLVAADAPAAAAQVAHGLALVRRKGVWAWAADLLLPALDVGLAAGRLGAVRDLVAEADAGLSGVDAPYAHAVLAAGHARLAAAAGEPTAPALLRRAVDRHEELGLPYHAARLAERGATDADELGALVRTYTDLGATVDAARCRHRLRGLGTPTPSRRGRRGYGAQLSPRERDVAVLLAGGATNREIAATLFISRRTVEEYVGKVMRKVGATSRREVRAPE
ncbi:LuxR family transcriptional regulator [Pilimelia anulata]|uniref:LuxR family transcriptional regulator n=1 Tax=Pilimelia anulata TaxID=53371 RepID=A0A8J3BBK5_9ACTN|nr:LuxR family transcriptional regulator [Pilimelia anulata]GGK07297.1 LuxR family transcriptional regulator [Pilimelia anulata]